MDQETNFDIGRLLTLAGIVAGSMIIFRFIIFLVQKWSKKQSVLPKLMKKHLMAPGYLLVIAIALVAALPLIQKFLQPDFYRILWHTLKIGIIVAAGFFVMRVITVLRDMALHYYQTENPTDFTWRRAKTKFQLLQRVLNFVIMLGTVSVALMTFDSVRQVGSTILASAGVVGIIIGFAAQRSLGSLFAGIQIAISQPIRLEDTVVVEDEFGTVGEINLTYVVINTWDGRRRIVPINYFLEKSFENWTRMSPEVVGKVKIYTDYNLPVEEVRKVLRQWLEASELWDKRTWGLRVTGATDKTMEIRATMSARNPDDAWDLECMVREKLIEHIRTHYPDALPKNRLTFDETTKNQVNRKADRDEKASPSV